MLYKEFNQYKSIKNPLNPLCHYYEDEEGNSFFVEPGFYTAIMGYEDKSPDKLPLILNKMDELIKKNHHIVFTADYENPFVNIDGYIYLEIEDITNPLGVTWVDDSRPSDYGD